MPIGSSKNITTAWQLSTILTQMQSCLTTIQKDQDKCHIIIQKMLPYVDRMKRLQQQKKALNRQVKQIQQRMDSNYSSNKQKQNNKNKKKGNQKKKLNQITANLKKQNLINLQKISIAKNKLKLYQKQRKQLQQQILQKNLSKYKQELKSYKRQIQNLISAQSLQYSQGIFRSISDKYLSNQIKTNKIDEYFQKEIESVHVNLGQIDIKFQTLKDKKRIKHIKSQLEQIFENINKLPQQQRQLSSNLQYKQYLLSKCELLSQISQLCQQIDLCKQKIRIQLLFCVQKIQRSIFETKRIKYQNKQLDQQQLSLILKPKQIQFRKYLQFYHQLKLNIHVFKKYINQKIHILEWKYNQFHQTYYQYEEIQIVMKMQNVKSYTMDTIQKLQHVYAQIQPVEKFQFLHVSQLVFF